MKNRFICLIETKNNREGRPDQRVAVFLDPARILIASDETLFDIVPAIICQSGHRTDLATDAQTIRNRVSDGLTNWAMTLFPGAVEALYLAPGFQYDFDQVITIDHAADMVNLQTGPEPEDVETIETRWFFSSETADRRGGPRPTSTSNRIHPERPFAIRMSDDREDTDPRDMTSGSLAYGIFKSVFQTGGKAPSETSLRFAGALLGAALDGRIPDLCAREVSSTAGSHFGRFYLSGELRHDRGWSARRILPSPTFLAWEACVNAGIVAIGEKLWAEIVDLTPAQVSRAFRQHLADIGEDPVQFHLGWQDPEARTSHEKIEATALVRRLLEICEAEIEKGLHL